MAAFSSHRAYQHFLNQQTAQVATDVWEIEERMLMLSMELEGSIDSERSICRKLKDAWRTQMSLHERVEEVGEKLRICKSLLASLHS